jgi:hypothetical protein
MKRLLTIILALASFGFLGLGTEVRADSMVKAATPQVRVQIGSQRRNRRWRERDRWRHRDWNRGERVGYGYGRTTVQTRLVQRGFHTYRETYRVRYLPNGLTQTTLISRVRVN